MNLFTHFHAVVHAELTALMRAGALPDGLDLARVAVEPPRDPAHGDLSTNAAMVLTKAAGMPPRSLAALLAERLKAQPDVAAVEIAGPGFLNLRLADGFWQARLAEVLRAGRAYGDSTLGGGRAVNVEYVSANPTGPLHVGHGRGAVVGDALANLLAKAGFAVTREYYVNDAGAQVEVLARSAYLRYREALGETIDVIPEGLYPGDYLKRVGQDLAAEFGDKYLGRPEEGWLALFRDGAIASMLSLIKEDLAQIRARDRRARRHRGGDRGAGAPGARLCRHARAAQGQAAGGLGTATAEAFPLDRLRRRCRPAVAEIGRRLDLFRRRHRLSFR